MATELVIKSWCDPCLEAGEHVPGETVTVAVGNVAPFDVEVCPRHAKPLAEAVTALAALGRAPGKTVQPGAGRPSKGARRPDEAHEGPNRCPECGAVYSTAAILRSHLRDKHGKSLADVGLAPANVTCPDCGGKFPSNTGLASHVRTAHGHTLSEQSA